MTLSVQTAGDYILSQSSTSIMAQFLHFIVLQFIVPSLVPQFPSSLAFYIQSLLISYTHIFMVTQSPSPSLLDLQSPVPLIIFLDFQSLISQAQFLVPIPNSLQFPSSSGLLISWCSSLLVFPDLIIINFFFQPSLVIGQTIFSVPQFHVSLVFSVSSLHYFFNSNT